MMLGATPELLVLGEALGKERLPDVFSIPETYLQGVYILEADKVNLDDFVHALSRPGGIIRVRSQDAIRFIPSSLEGFERIAGMISDAA